MTLEKREYITHLVGNMEKEVFRHYGSSKFDRDLFIPVTNMLLHNKPLGGLWACPTKDVDATWYEWSITQDFKTEKLDKHFDFTIKDNAKILVINDVEQLTDLPRTKIPEDLECVISSFSSNEDIDFETLAKEYDGMLVYIYRSKEAPELFSGIFYKLYGWDVDSLLVFNPDIIEEVS